MPLSGLLRQRFDCASAAPTVQQHADLRRRARGIGHLLLGELSEPVSDPHETEHLRNHVVLPDPAVSPATSRP